MVMRYIVRSLKYLLLLCVLIAALMWYRQSVEYQFAGMSYVDMLRLHFGSREGMMLIVVVIALALFYPKFGYMRRVVRGVDIVKDRVRIDNAMSLYGYEFKRQNGDMLIYGARSIFRRLWFMLEDEIEVRMTEEGVELSGIRRSTARIAYQIEQYHYNSRFERDGDNGEGK